MSERDPALALFEFGSISAGIVAGDAMIKASPLGSIYAGTTHPGRYLVLVSGDTASVDEAVMVAHDAAAADLLAEVFLPDVHPSVAAAISGNAKKAPVGDEALGIVETTTVSAAIDAADAGVKAAAVELSGLKLADGLAGKGYALFSGVVAEVEAATDAAVARVTESGELLRSDVIAQLHDEMAANLRKHVRFLKRVETRKRR